MLKNQKGKLFSNKFILNFLENETKAFNYQDKFEEIASSLAYYLKSFSNIKKLLDYVSLLFKHLFDEKSILIIPLNDKGEVWSEYITFSGNIHNLKIEDVINKFFIKFKFSKKLKELSS